MKMPQESHYQGLNLAESLRELAHHHYEGRTRHISLFECQLILRAATIVELGGGKPTSNSERPNRERS